MFFMCIFLKIQGWCDKIHFSSKPPSPRSFASWVGLILTALLVRHLWVYRVLAGVELNFLSTEKTKITYS